MYKRRHKRQARRADQEEVGRTKKRERKGNQADKTDGQKDRESDWADSCRWTCVTRGSRRSLGPVSQSTHTQAASNWVTGQQVMGVVERGGGCGVWSWGRNDEGVDEK